MENYNKVPDIITGKDLNYLSDAFEWNSLSLKKTNDNILKVSDDNIKNILKKACSLFDANLNNILNILEGGLNE